MLGTSLQQIQPIHVGDLKDTPVYDRLLKAWNLEGPIPMLFTILL